MSASADAGGVVQFAGWMIASPETRNGFVANGGPVADDTTPHGNFQPPFDGDRRTSSPTRATTAIAAIATAFSILHASVVSAYLACSGVPDRVRGRAAELFGATADVTYEPTTASLFAVTGGSETKFLITEAGIAFGEAMQDVRDAGGCETARRALERPLAHHDIPAAVWRTALGFSGGVPVHDAVLDSRDGLLVYRFSFEKGRSAIVVDVLADGEFCAAKEWVPAAQVPSIVRATATSLRTPGARLRYEHLVVSLFEVTGRDRRGRDRMYLVDRAGAAFARLTPDSVRRNDYRLL